MRRVTAAIAENIKCFMIEPRCLIGGDESNGSFPGDFVELEKWFRQPLLGGWSAEVVRGAAAPGQCAFDHENRKVPISKPTANDQRPNVQAETTRTRIRRSSSCGIS